MLVTLPRCVALAGLGFFLSLAACGGSSSETPPPLQPLPVNVHYDRSSTTLPGELGMPAPEPTDAGAPPSEPPAAETIGTAAPAAPGTAPGAPAAAPVAPAASALPAK
jgi:hypothetical protein